MGKSENRTFVSVKIINDDDEIDIAAYPIINTSKFSNARILDETKGEIYFFIFDEHEFPNFWNRDVDHDICLACFSPFPFVCHSMFTMKANSTHILMPNSEIKYALIASDRLLYDLGIKPGSIIVDFDIVEGGNSDKRIDTNGGL